ncbi:hypothetical protein AA313_de0206567 [Arthrobotrys entomopaga]|nr:hypothetical protein AA313_de0206567 [Arthrobotrys entomopaga]
MGPLGLGTIPPAAFQGTIFARQGMQMNTQSQAHQMNSNPYESAVLTPEQFHAMSQSLARRASTATDAKRSPMSESSTISLHTAPAGHSNMGSPDPSAIRRLSMPNVVPGSPLRSSGYNSPSASQLGVETPSYPRQSRMNLNMNNVSHPVAGPNLSSRSPRINTGTQTTVSENQVFPTSSQNSGNSIPEAESPFFDPDQYFFDLSLPRNEQDLYYDPTTNTQHQPSMMFGQSAGQQSGSGFWSNFLKQSSQNPMVGGDQSFKFSDVELNGRRTVGTDFPKHSEQSVTELWEESERNETGQQ